MKFFKNEDGQAGIIVIVAIVAVAMLLIAGLAWGLPQYNIWQKEMSGKAQLAEAEWSKKIMIEDAKAQLDSAELNKQRMILEAEGIAEANAIISGSITPEYIQYKFVEGLNDGSTEVIYVPTEANIPVMEAGRRTWDNT